MFKDKIRQGICYITWSKGLVIRTFNVFIQYSNFIFKCYEKFTSFDGY